MVGSNKRTVCYRVLRVRRVGPIITRVLKSEWLGNAAIFTQQIAPQSGPAVTVSEEEPLHLPAGGEPGVDVWASEDGEADTPAHYSIIIRIVFVE